MQKAHKATKIFAVSGIKNSGKTTLIEKLVAALNNQGYKVGVIKHDGHEFEADREGTDSFRHKKAGAKNVIIYSKTKIMMIKDEENPSIEQLIDLQQDMDIIIIEGMKYSKIPKIEIVRSAVSNESVCDKNTLLALVTDTDLEIPQVKKVDLNDIDTLLNIIKEYIIK